MIILLIFSCHGGTFCFRNLMKQAENCVDCKITHLYFENDSLVFAFAKSKGHQAGEECVGPWHIYANPFEPEICPVLALARYLLSFPDKLRSNTALFEGTAQYNRYTVKEMMSICVLESHIDMTSRDYSVILCFLLSCRIFKIQYVFSNFNT